KAIVSDYLAMLDDQVSGRFYSKAEHRNALRKVVNRSPGSIERKHQNISAVLEEMGLPWIHGYRPLGNFQDALVSVIEAQLDNAIERLDQVLPSTVEPPLDVSSIFVPPPPPFDSGKARVPPRPTKYDPATRDAANRALGKAGEDYVLRIER